MPAKPKAGPLRAVLTYFLDHPETVDSVEGIARWRLTQELIERTVRETAEAVNWLVSRGFLIESSTPTSGGLYSLNDEKRCEAERLAKGDSRRNPGERG